MKNISFALFFLAAILIAHSAYAADSGSAAMSASLAKYEPFPAEAGQYVDVWFKIENTGSGTADSVVVEFLPRFPFSLESGDATKSLGAMPQGSVQLVQYRVRVDEMAASGNNTVQLRFRSGAFGTWATKEFAIIIQAHDAVLSVSNIRADEMVPGKVQAVSLSLDNLADAYLKDISVTLDFSSTTLPFATLNAINEKRIGGISSRMSANISFDVITAPDAASGVYKVPLSIKYSDATGKQYTRSYTIGFIVNPEPEFEVSIQKYDAITWNSAGAVTISISNTGPGSIKFLTMELLPSEDYEIIGESATYLGNLDPDDYETATFRIYANKGMFSEEKKTIPLKLSLNYKDGLNNAYAMEETLDMRIYSSSEIGRYGIGGGGGGSSIITLIIVAIIIYYVYRKYFKKKEKEKTRG